MTNKILTVLCALFGLGMVVFGANKLVPFLPMPEMSAEMQALFGAFATLKWIMPLVAIVEIIGGILIAIPKTRALGAIVILPITVGIIAHHLAHDPGGLAGPPAIFAAINVWAILASIKQYQPMIK
jgi:putative oxidoreductase